MGLRGQVYATVPHQVLRYGWNNPVLLQTMIHVVPQRVKMEFARTIFDILDACAFQIMAKGFSLGKNAAKDPICRCRTPLFREPLKSCHSRVRRTCFPCLKQSRASGLMYHGLARAPVYDTPTELSRACIVVTEVRNPSTPKYRPGS